MTDKELLSEQIAVLGEEDESAGYDESSYPAKAESDEESDLHTDISEGPLARPQDNSGEARKAEEVSSSGDDASCIVCAEVLVDPCTLHCGHSFCQLCLASVWKNKALASPANLQCPICRQPWGSYPGINIQLRNIIERSHGKLVELRRGQRSDADAAILAQYSQSKDKIRIFRQPTAVLHRVPARWCIILLAFIVCGALVVMVTAVVLLTLTGAGGEFMRKPVSRWNNADVMAWVGGLGNWATHNISRTFFKEKITGPQLVLLDRTVLKSIGIHTEFHVQSLLLAIDELKQEDHSTPRNFHEFMAAHRKQTVLIGVLYKLWPRITFFYVYIFEYYDVFLPVWHCAVSNQRSGQDEADPTITQEPSGWQLLLFCVEVLVVPHYIVGLCTWYWSNTHPWLCTAIALHCVWTTQREAKLTVSYVTTLNHNNWKQNLFSLAKMLGRSVLHCALAVICGFIVWPLVPYFLCDWLIYALIWNTALVLAFKPLKLLTNRRRPRPPPHQDPIP